MRTLGAALIPVKNSLENASPFLVLAEIQFSGETIRLVRNEANITYLSETWTAFPFAIDTIAEMGKDEVPAVSLSVSNVSRAIQAYLEEYDGGIDATVIIRVVHADNLSGTEDNTALVVLEFTVTNCTADSQNVTFTLGSTNPWNRRVPMYRMHKNFCRWKFKSAQCGYAGAETECKKTLTRCRELSNSSRFGGFPGVGYGGLRVYV